MGLTFEAMAQDSRDQGVWRAQVWVEEKVQSQHAFKAQRRAAAIKRNGQLLMKLQKDKIELSWNLAMLQAEGAQCLGSMVEAEMRQTRDGDA